MGVEPKHFPDIFWRLVEEQGDRSLFRSYEGETWVATSWREAGNHVRSLALALIAAGVGVQQSVGIFAPNSPRWLEADLAIQAIRGVKVPIHSTASQEHISQILGEALPPILFVGNLAQAEQVLALGECSQALRIVVLYGSVELHSDTSSRVQSLAEFLELGRDSGAAESELARRAREASPEDLVSILYTSGTSGNVKGAMLTQLGVLHQLKGHLIRLPDMYNGDVSFCVLPLSHVFENLVSHIFMGRGMTICFAEIGPTLMDRMREMSPMVVCLVPRILERVHAAIHQKLEFQSSLSQRLFHWAVGVGKKVAALDGKPPSLALAAAHRLADALVLRKVRAVFGTRLNRCVVGGAALNEEIWSFFDAAGLFLDCGYGLSETLATVSSTPRGFRAPGAVGQVLPGVEVRIDPGNGEILVRGPHVMRGYFRNEKATKEAFSDDGFLRTGDVGHLDERGALFIVDRLKDLFKTSCGKYVAPQRIEGILALDPFIAQACVVGDGRKFVGALIVPPARKLEEVGRNASLEFEEPEEILHHPVVRAFFAERIRLALQTLPVHEQVREFRLVLADFTVESGELTPTLKLRRRFIGSKYKEDIEAIYKESER